MATLSQGEIWRAIDAQAERFDMTPSAMARMAGLDPTSFNRSKRGSATADGRPRWPSTESLAKLLEATGVNFSEFAALTEQAAPASGRRGAPLIGLAQAGGTDVRTGANYDRPGRTIDADIVKFADTSAKPSRAIDDKIKTGADYDRPGRTISDESVKTGGEYTKPGRALDAETVRTGGDTSKPGRALDDPVKPVTIFTPSFAAIRAVSFIPSAARRRTPSASPSPQTRSDRMSRCR